MVARVMAPDRLTRSYTAASRKMMSKVILFTPAFLLRTVLASWCSLWLVVMGVSGFRRP